MTLTNLTKTLCTVLPDGTEIMYLNAITTGWGNLHRMGERKRIYLEYDSDVDLDNFIIYINPSTFLPLQYVNTMTGPGTYYYAYQFPADLTGMSGTAYQCVLQSPLMTASIHNTDDFKVYVIPDGKRTFQIMVEFYMMADNKGYLAPRNNYEKLLKDAQDNPTSLLDNNGNRNLFAVPDNVYNAENRSPRVYFYMMLPGAPYPGVSISIEEKFLGFQAGWYYRDASNAQSWFTNMHFEVIRQGNLVNNLMAAPNDVYIFANTDNVTHPVTYFVVGVLKTDVYAHDDTVGWEQNYDNIEWQVIKASNPSTGKIAAPMTDPAEISPQQWMGNFVLKGLQNGAGYRLIGIVYSFPLVGTPKVNSFISPIYYVDGAPFENGDGFSARATLSDYNHEYEGNDLECCIEERMKSTIKLEFPFDQWKNHILDRLGLVVPNDIRAYLEAVELLMYEEYPDPYAPSQMIRQYVDMKYASKIGTNTFQAQTGMTLMFDNNWAEFTYEWRNRCEQWVANLQTTNDGNTQFPPTSNQYWGGRTIKIQWNLYFIYNQLALTDTFTFNQQIRVKDYGEMSVKYLNEDPDDPGFEELSNICNDETLCFAGILQNPSLEDRKLIVNIFPDGSAVNNIEEAEVWVGNELPKLTTNKVVNEEEDYHLMYDETAAKFCIDGSKLYLNSSYQISALAKRYISSPPKRITENGNLRITENKNQRIIN